VLKSSKQQTLMPKKSDAFAVERINIAAFTEEMARGFSMELIFRKTVLTLDELELALMHFNHQDVLSVTILN
jgi:hypothetical protein